MRDERRRGSAWPGEPHAIVQVVIENQVQGHVKQAVGGNRLAAAEPALESSSGCPDDDWGILALIAVAVDIDG